MTEKEIAEIRRRFKADKSNIGTLVGCYVNASGDIISQFKLATHFMDSGEKEKLFAVLRKTLTGTHGKNLIDIEFSTAQVVNSEEHSLLMNLKNSKLEDSESIQLLFDKIIASSTSEQAYLILIAIDTYDIPYKSKDAVEGSSNEFSTDEVFTYMVCSVCPIKETKAELLFSPVENEFYSSTIESVVSAPVLGFMFPAFDDRSSNIYSALHFSKDITGKNEAFVNSIFNVNLPMPAQIQKDTFNEIIESSLENACSYDVLQNVHTKVSEMVAMHKEAKEDEPLLLSKKEFKNILADCDVPANNVQTFETAFDDRFGEETTLPPKNLIDVGKLNVKTGDVTVNVNTESSDLLQTKTIDGVKYLMIRLDDTVIVNGIELADIK